MVTLCAVLALVIVLSGCTPEPVVEKFVERFTVAAGRDAIKQTADATLPTQAEEIIIPSGYYPVEILSGGIIKISDVAEEGGNVGLCSSNGAVLVPAEYAAIVQSGPFFMAYQTGDNGRTYFFFYRNGSSIPITIDDEEVVMYALSDKFFVVKNTVDSQVFDKDGKAYFATMLSASTDYTVGDNYIIACNSKTNLNSIYDTSDGYARHIKSYFGDYERNLYYNLIYQGGGKFLAIANYIAGTSNYSYRVSTEKGDVCYGQRLYSYNAETDESADINADFHILSITNRYSQGLTYEEKAAFSLQDGYNSVWVAETDEDKYLSASVAYVMNSDCILTVRFQESLSAELLTYKGGLGFSGNALADYSAGLFGLDGKAVWSVQGSYQYQNYNNGYLVAGRVQDGVTRYGAFDSDGNVAIPFDYEFLSSFAEGYAVGKTAENWVIVDKDGNTVVIDGFEGKLTALFAYTYSFTAGGKVGVRSYAGEELIGAEYAAVINYGYSDGVVYYILSDGAAYHLFALK